MQIVANASGNRVAWTASNDDTNFATITTGFDTNNVSSISANTTGSTVGQAYVVPVFARYLKFAVTNYVGGSTTITVTLRRNVVPYSVRTTTAPITASGSQFVEFTNGLNASSGNSGYLGSTTAAQCDDTSITALTENNLGNAREDCGNHALVTRPWETGPNTWSYASATSGIVNTTTAVTIKAAGSGTLRNYVNSCQIDHDTLGGVTELAIRDGAGGTVLWRGKLQTTAIEGSRVIFETPLRGSAATLTEVVTLTGVTGGVYVNCQGFTAP
jgi:hypothetical protein